MKKARAEALRKEIKEGTDCLDESVAIAKLALHKVRSALTSTALASTALASTALATTDFAVATTLRPRS